MVKVEVMEIDMNNFYRILYPNASDLEFKAGLEFLYKFWTIAIIVIVTIFLICLWKIFKKAKVEPWEALIPGYNIVVLYNISGISPFWLLFAFGMLIPSIRLMCYMAYMFIEGTQKAMLCHKFNKSLAFTIGMIIFDFIFFPILAFGKAKYNEK